MEEKPDFCVLSLLANGVSRMGQTLGAQCREGLYASLNAVLSPSILYILIFLYKEPCVCTLHWAPQIMYSVLPAGPIILQINLFAVVFFFLIAQSHLWGWFIYTSGTE